jgi:hypothetical protein
MSLLEWSPRWAPHVVGVYEAKPPGEEAKVTGRCGVCGEDFRRTCASGAPREWIARFARVHLHRDPLGEKKE